MKQGRWAIAAVSVVLGVMIVVQYRMTRDIADNNVRLQRAGDLAIQLTEATKERDELQKQLDMIKQQGTVEGFKKENENLRFEAGLTDVTGKGVLVTINDSKVPVKSGENPNLYLIHDEDMLRIVNELRAGGAEAIAINDQRLIGTSEIRCSGPTITVNGKIFAPPFVIKVIGNPQTLTAALNMRGGVVESLKYWGIEISMQKADNVNIPAYNGTFRREYIHMAEGEVPAS